MSKVLSSGKKSGRTEHVPGQYVDVVREHNNDDDEDYIPSEDDISNDEDDDDIDDDDSDDEKKYPPPEANVPELHNPNRTYWDCIISEVNKFNEDLEKEAKNVWIYRRDKFIDEKIVPILNKCWATVEGTKTVMEFRYIMSSCESKDIHPQKKPIKYTDFKHEHEDKIIKLERIDTKNVTIIEEVKLVSSWKKSIKHHKIEFVYPHGPTDHQRLISNNETDCKGAELVPYFKDFLITKEQTVEYMTNTHGANYLNNMQEIYDSCPVISHIRDIICNGDAYLFSYFIRWWAFIVQTKIKTASAIILFSEPGAVTIIVV